jgi:hypothetical protein
MAPLIAGLIQAAPSLIGLFTGDEKKDSGVVGKALEVAEALTGMKGEQAVDAINSDPIAAVEYQKAILESKNELERLAYADRESARNMHKENHQQADNIAERVMKWNLAYVVLTLVIQCVSIYLLKDFGTQLTIISTACGWVLKGLLDERRDVTGFYFGSALGSRLKD